MFEWRDAFVTVMGTVSIFLGLYRKDPIGVLWGIVAIGLGYPITRLFGYHKESID